MLSSRAAPHPHPLRHAVSAAFARLASSRFASLARSALRALESPLREGRAQSRPGVLDFVRNIFSALLSTSPTVLVHCRWAEVRGRRSGRRELARRRAPSGGARRGGPTIRAIHGRGARSGRERRSEIWLDAQTPPRPHGEADADAGWRGTTAPRRPRAADASQAALATSVFAPAPDRVRADRARENHRESAADSRKQARRPAQGARTAKRQGVTAISRLPNPRDARRNAHPAPSRRAPGIGRTCTAHEAATSAWHLAAEAEFSLPAKRRSPLRPLFTGLRRFSCTKKWGTSKTHNERAALLRLAGEGGMIRGRNPRPRRGCPTWKARSDGLAAAAPSLRGG